jgi:hypothetical protein
LSLKAPSTRSAAVAISVFLAGMFGTRQLEGPSAPRPVSVVFPSIGAVHVAGTQPREICVLMTEESASPGARSRAGPPRRESTSHGGVSTTFQSCKSSAIGAASIPTRLSSGECRLKQMPRLARPCIDEARVESVRPG